MAMAGVSVCVGPEKGGKGAAGFVKRAGHARLKIYEGYLERKRL